MTGPHRLPATAPGGFGTEVDRSEPVGFRLGGRVFGGLYGDTLASALLASGVRKFGGSPLLGRPRGLMALGLEDQTPMALEGDAGPWSLVSGSEITLREGLRARQASSGVETALRRFAPVMSPDRRALPAAQQMLERLRRALPLPGPRLPAVEPPPFSRVETCGVLVIGAGLAGLAAAAALRSAGVDVRVVEASRRAGGLADLYGGTVDGLPLAGWASAQAAGLRDRDALKLGATAISIEADGSVCVMERDDPQRPGRVTVTLVSASAVVLATGWRERPLVFPGNDRPGVMLATTARALLRRHAVAPGSRVMVATTCDEGYRTATDLREAGVEVGFVLDARADPQGPAVDMAKALGAPVSLSTVVTGVEFAEGEAQLAGVRTRNRFGEGATAGARILEADALVVSGGLAPRDELARLCGLGSDQGVFSASAGPNAVEAVAGGWAAGAAAAARLGAEPTGPAPVVEASADEAGEVAAVLPARLDEPGAAEAFVDFGADVTLADLVAAAARRGPAPAAVARRLGLGLGPDGGRLGGDVAALAFERITGVGFAPPSPGRPTLATLAARARLRDA
ncbi:FAD-dependent oxidoreductase [Chenggangzhangella methanolivorans]|uniref:FAD-dependent oxidoreductase n=1 Tax=Chenggangzhangella methanolivorans TaxID=1437009 RepID=A0A9E6R9T1_9HYPH|nr:FAD-dependent oxidoreductase [Chenggangzhangella methanolivorans]QZO00764.1 FAD-dependent oxidoreductase [Chenggangzhangella methanolivorans]